MCIPRPEHPNPQFQRDSFENLNGRWEFEIDKSMSGKTRKLFKAEKFADEIIVPFCPESTLSGIGETDFLNSVWYKRTINIKDKSRRIILHIGACDYLSEVYINGKSVGTHKGGYTSFSFDITDFVEIGENILVINAVYNMTKGLDETRPVIDSSGGVHVVTDIFDTHDYTQDVEVFKGYLECLCADGVMFGALFRDFHYENREKYNGEPVFVSEYGGIKWDTENVQNAWGYGDTPKTQEEFIRRYKGLTEALLNNDKILGFCYTQLYDVEQETNGLYSYDRTPKFDISIFKEINVQKAAIED